MQNMLKATPTMRQLLQTMQVKTTRSLPSQRACTFTQGHKTEGPTGTKFSTERLGHDCRAGELTQTLQPILPQSPNYLGASWDCGHLWQSGCQNLYTGRGLQNCGGNPNSAKSGRTAPSRSAEAGFLAGTSSLTDLTGPTSILLTNWQQRPGLPLNCQEEKAQLKAGVRLVAAAAGGSSSWAKRTSWDLHYHRQTRMALSFRKP